MWIEFMWLVLMSAQDLCLLIFVFLLSFCWCGSDDELDSDSFSLRLYSVFSKSLIYPAAPLLRLNNWPFLSKIKSLIPFSSCNTQIWFYGTLLYKFYWWLSLLKSNSCLSDDGSSLVNSSLGNLSVLPFLYLFKQLLILDFNLFNFLDFWFEDFLESVFLFCFKLELFTGFLFLLFFDFLLFRFWLLESMWLESFSFIVLFSFSFLFLFLFWFALCLLGGEWFLSILVSLGDWSSDVLDFPFFVWVFILLSVSKKFLIAFSVVFAESSESDLFWTFKSTSSFSISLIIFRLIYGIFVEDSVDDGSFKTNKN